MDFLNKVVWITGASSGIGESLAYAFSECGANLIISSRNRTELDRVKDSCKDPQKVKVLAMDISEISEIELIVQSAICLFGSIDILVNNAGISHRSLTIETHSTVYKKVFDVNFFGAVEVTNHVVKQFLKQNSGYIVAISSMSTILTPPNRTAYVASKFAMEGYLKTLNHEIWKTPIKILVVKPGAVRTNIAINSITGDGKPFTDSESLIEEGMAPELLARQILKAVKNNKKVLIAGTLKHKVAAFLGILFPSAVYPMVKNYK